MVTRPAFRSERDGGTPARRLGAFALQKARDNQLITALSNPCFEYWFLLHFEDTRRSFTDRANLIRHLRDKHLDNYEKEKDVSNLLKLRRGDTLERGERYERLRGGDAVLQRNASTNVHKLVKELLDTGFLINQCLRRSPLQDGPR